MVDDVVRDIPEEMVEKAVAEAVAEWQSHSEHVACERYGLGKHPTVEQTISRALSAALAGRTVLELPEPELVLRAQPGVRAHAVFDVDSYVVTALAMEQGPRVNVRGGPLLWADEAERRGAALIAAAREARRLAAGSGVGDQHD